VKPCSAVQVGTRPYDPPPGTYPNAEILNPVEEGDCGLIGSFLPMKGGVSDGAASTVPVVCTQRECVADDKQLRLGGPQGSLRDARELILAQLRETPGVMPAGAGISYTGTRPTPPDFAPLLIGLRADLALRRVSPRTKDYGLVLQTTGSHSDVELKEIGRTSDPKVRYYLTDRGVLKSSIGDGSIGGNAALDEAPEPDLAPVLALVGERVVVYCGPTSDSGILWTYHKSGYKRVRDCKAKP
jgi:hypothetical protein